MKTINLFGEIGWDVNLASVIDQMNSYKGDSLTINISGPGGYVDEAFAIYSYLATWKKENNAKITFNIIGTCASCDSFIPMVGDEIVVNSGSRMMIHLASSFGGGNSEDLRKMADDLEHYSNQIADIYVAFNKKGKSLEDIKGWMSNETYFNAQELIDYGFATKFEDVRPTAKIKTLITNNNDSNMEKKIEASIWAKVKAFLGAKNENPVIVNMDGTLEDGTAVVITPVEEGKGAPMVGDSVAPPLPEMKVVTIGSEKYEITSDDAGLITSVVEVVETETMDAAEVEKIVNDLTAKFEADTAALKNELESLKAEKKAIEDSIAAKDVEIANLKQAGAPPINGKKPENNKDTKPKSVKQRALEVLDMVKQS